MAEHHSFCRLCLVNCGVIVTTDGHNRLVSVRGDKAHPATSGYACFTGLQSPDAHNSPARLRHPLKRMPDGSFEPIALEQALDEIAVKLGTIRDQHGAGSIAAFRGTANYSNIAAATMLPAWLAALGSPAFFLTMTVDQSAKWVNAGRLGTWHAGRDNFCDSDVLILVGGNPMVSGTVLGFPCANPLKQIKEARARGLKLIVIDPRRSETAKFADIFLQPLPGEDVTIAAGLLHIIIENGWQDDEFCARHVNGLDELKRAIAAFDPGYVERRAGVPASSLRAAAEAFAHAAGRGFAVTGTGPDMGPHSNLAEHLIECLNVVCGRYRRPGDLVVNPVLLGPRRALRAEAVSPGRSWEKGHKSRIRDTGVIFGEMMSCVLAEEMLLPGEGQIRSLFVVGGNPVSVLPDPDKTARAFQELDLLVTIDPMLTSTARLSHYVIPPKLQYERPDSLGLHDLIPAPLVQYTHAVATPPDDAEVVDEWYVFWALAKRLAVPITLNGIELDMQRPPSTERILEIVLSQAQLPIEEIRQATAGRLYAEAPQYVEPAREGASGRFEVIPPDVGSEIAQALGAVTVTGFSHRLSVRRMRGVINTAYHELPGMRRRHRFNPAYVNSADLDAQGLQSGDSVEIVSAHGRIAAIVEADNSVRPGVVSMTHGWGDGPVDETTDSEQWGSSTSFLVSADADLETINSMARLTAIPVNIVAR